MADTPAIPTGAIRELIRTYADVDVASIDELLSDATVTRFHRFEPFLRAGDSADAVGFVVSGLFKAYCLTPDGDAYIRSFCSHGHFIGAFAAAIRGVPADVTIEATEPSAVVGFRYQQLRSYFSRSASWQEFGRKLTEWHYIERETKEYRLQACTALERYDAFVIENPHVLGRVSQGDIASYIGVTPETLSRILKTRRS